MIDKSDLKLIELVNSKRSSLKILNFGASIFSFRIKNNKGKLIDVVVGPKEASAYITQEYKEENKCFGATIGRYAGRISGPVIKLGGKEYPLSETENGVQLHGGQNGFQCKLWDIEKVENGVDPFVVLSYTSENGEEGFPGKLQVKAKYQLTENDEVKISYTATTDKRTVVNITNHSYFNLNGQGSVSDHFLHVNALKILELDEKKLPTGNLIKVKETPKEFSSSKLIGNRELDDVFVTKKGEETQAQLFSPLSGIKMRLSSNQPALVVYSPESLPDKWTYSSPIDSQYPAIALEAQNYPDSPNFRNFPSSVLRPGETYENRTCFAFSVK